jgi:hypothetical protein
MTMACAIDRFACMPGDRLVGDRNSITANALRDLSGWDVQAVAYNTQPHVTAACVR